MSSINPVILMPGSIGGARRQRWELPLSSSLTMGAGQFCTNPGLVLIGIEGNGHRTVFAEAAAAERS